jgi:protein-S-isoprenylcysteine O-methyltransferase Ste14
VTGGGTALAALLASGAAAIGARRALGPPPAEQRAGLRSALFFACLTVGGEVTRALHQGRAIDSAMPPADGVITTSLIFLVAAWVAPRSARGWGIHVLAGIAWWLASLGVERVVLDTPAEPSAALWLGARILLGWALYRAMVTRRHARLRALAHAASFGATVTLLLPFIVLHAAGRRVVELPLSVPRFGLAAGLVLGALALGGAASVELARTGGTPDPLDPPDRLVTTGVYARIRHPLQIAEVLLVLAPAAASGELAIAAYAALFAAALLGPMRRLEEELLCERFGDAAERYRARVPALWPWGGRTSEAGT